MPTLAKPTSVVDVDPNFELQLRRLRDQAQERAEQLSEGGQVHWMRPLGWDGNPFDFESMALPFSREVANQQFVQATSSGQAPGVAGDLIAAT